METTLTKEPVSEKNTDRQILDQDQILHDRARYWALRRIQDVILSALALVVLSPLMLITAIVILIESPGASPIFSQERVGKGGKKFRLYKFRSMIPNAESKLDELLQYNEAKGPAFKIKDDPRITKVGRFIRKTSIDELPQLLNILKGDMSIVGPRPPLPREVEQYDAYQMQRLYVTPGLTCYWQIQPRRNEISFDEWVDLDVKYIANSSFVNDWKIIFGTFSAVFGMNGE